MTTPVALEDRVRAALAPHLLVVRELGVGGMGTVFLAREPALKRTVALKVLSPELAAVPAARARFEREAQAVASLSHPNIVGVHGVGELDDGTPYFVMQYVAGRSLATRLADDGPLGVAEARRIMGEVASALAAAHAKGIIHRDIKPANILCEEESARALVSDFGIAAVAPDGGKTDTRLTQTGMVVGTPQYMSPEQLMSEPPSEKSDMYALGLLGYEMLAGAAPFEATTPHELIAAHLRDTPKKLSEIRDDVDPETESIIAACLAKQPERRPTADDVAQRLVPGAGALLEWPPPGLEELRGGIATPVRRLALGSAALLVSVVPLLTAGPEIASAQASAFTTMLLLLALTGLGLIAWAALGLLGAAARAGHAVRAGFGWFTVAEVFADRAGDTGQLIAGSGRFAPLAPEVRGALRRLRLLRALAHVTAAAAPLPLIIVVAIAGARDVAGPRTIWIAVVVPLLLLLVARRLGLVERKAVDRRTSKRQAGPRPNLAKLAEPWSRTFDAVSGGQGMGRGPSARPGLGRAGAWLAAAALLLLGALALPIVLAGVFGPLYWAITVPKFSNTQEKMRLADAMRPYGVAPDSAISLDSANAAFARLLNSSTPPSPLLLPVPPRTAVPWDEELPESLFAGARPREYRGPHNLAILAVARRGLSRAELAYLERVARADIWRDFAIVARAPRIDIVGSRYVTPFPDSANAMQLPIPRFTNTKEIAYAAAARAAYFLARGRRDSAETVLREVISFGFSMTEGPLLIETLIGTVIVSIGRSNLGQLWELTGDPRAARIRASHDSAVAAQSAREAATATAAAPLVDPQSLRAMVVAGATNPASMRSLRWELLMTAGASPCTNASELVFGQAPDMRDAFLRARRELVRYPADAALLDLLETAPERIRYIGTVNAFDRAIQGPARLAGALLGNARIPGCARLTAALLGNVM